MNLCICSVSLCSSIYIYIYEVYRKNNRTTVISNILQFNKLRGFLFKVISLESNALSHPTVPRFYVLLEGFFMDATQLHRYSLLRGLHTFKTGPLNDPFEHGEKKNTTRDKIRWIVRLYCDVPFGQELSDAQYTQSIYFSDVILPKLFFFIFSCITIIQIDNRCSPHLTSYTSTMLTSVLLLDSSFTFSHSSLNHLCHSKPHVHKMVLSLYTCWSISSACDPAGPKISGLFIPQYSYLNGFKKRRCKQ